MNRTFFTPVLVLSALALALLAWLWLAPGMPTRWRTWTPPSPQPPALDDARNAHLRANPAADAAYPEVLKRPLLMPTRRPPVVAAANADVAAPPPPPPPRPIDQARLLGIVAGPALAGVMVDYDGKPQFVRNGAELGGWRLTAVQGRTARFERGPEKRELEMPVPGSLPPADGAPASAPAGAAAARPSPAKPVPAVRSPAARAAPPAALAPAAQPAAPEPAASAPARPGGSFGGGGSRRP